MLYKLHIRISDAFLIENMLCVSMATGAFFHKTSFQTTLLFCVRSMLGVHQHDAIHMWHRTIEGLRTLTLFTVIIQSNGTVLVLLS